jgi:carbonic anhydrase
MRKHISRRGLLVLTGAAAGASAINAAAGIATPSAANAEVGEPTDPLARLLGGNQRFIAGRSRHPRQGPADVRHLASGQRPFAVVISCADSRVPPEIIFDQGLGDIFDNRVAGNIVDELLLGSIEYAVEELAPGVIVVLGHERCGAVGATVSALKTGVHAPGHIGVIVEALRPIVGPHLNAPDPVEAGVVANIRAQVRAIGTRSTIVHEHVAAGKLAIVGARYDLDTGRARILR